MRVRMAVFTALLILVTASLSSGMVYADDTLPQIRVYPPPSRDFPLKIYVYQTDYDELNNREFRCPAHSSLVELFYMVQRDLYNSILRFVEEYPEYRELALLSFVNTSDPDQADITFRVVISASNSSYVLHGEDIPYQIYIECDEINETNIHGARNVIFHEFMHSLGIGHPVNAYLTSRGEGELMAGNDPTIDMYPTTLDLYALYKVFFDNIREEKIVSLPSSIEYKMVIPYNVELKRLREEEDYLWSKLREANDLLTELQDENRKLRRENEDLRDENERLRQVVQDLDIKIQLMQQVLDRCQADRERLDERVTKLEDELKLCHDLGMELARKCNETIKDLVTKYNSLNKNYSLCLNYLKEYREACEAALEETQFRYRMLIYVITGIAMAFMAAFYIYGRRKYGIT